MTPSAERVRTTGADDRSFADLVERVTARLQAGEAFDDEALLREYPNHADRLRGLLPTLRALAGPDGTAEGSLVGTVVGDFFVVREAGRGGMGVVYEAEQVSLARRVALKVLPSAALLNPRQVQRFHNEARAAASLAHDHIVPVYAVGCDRGVHYYAMRFIDGRTLAQVLAARRAGGPGPVDVPTAPYAAGPATAGPGLAWREVARIGADAADALEHAHRIGVVHRDVKPSNLLLDDAGKVWVADLGLARTSSDPGLTRTDEAVGTLRYMSPEQALARHNLIDHRTDVYSLGATLYELLTGRPAVVGDTGAEVLRRLTDEDPAAPRSVDRAIPVDVETVVLKALAKDPVERYPTAAELAADLRRCLAGQPILARRPTVAQRLTRWARRHAAVVATALAGAVLLAAALAVSAVLLWQEGEAKARALGDAQFQEAEAKRIAGEREEQRKRAEANWSRALGALNHSWMWADHLASKEDWERAIPIYREAVAMLNVAVKTLPDNKAHLDKLTDYTWHFAASLGQAGMATEAGDVWLHVAEAHRLLLVELNHQTGWERTLINLVQAQTQAGEMLVAAGRPAKAEEVLREVPNLLRQLPEEVWGGLRESYEHWLLSAEAHLGVALANQGKLADAEQLYQAAVRRVAAVPRDGPLAFLFNIELARLLQRRGDVLLWRGCRDEAAASYREAVAVLEAFLAKPELWGHRSEQRGHVELAWLLAMCPEPACRNPQRALEVARNCKAESRAVGRVRGVALYRTGDFAEAWKLLQPSSRPAGPTGTQPTYAALDLYLCALVQAGRREPVARRYLAEGEAWQRQHRPGCAVLKALHEEAAAAVQGLSRCPGQGETPGVRRSDRLEPIPNSNPTVAASDLRAAWGCSVTVRRHNVFRKHSDGTVAPSSLPPAHSRGPFVSKLALGE